MIEQAKQEFHSQHVAYAIVEGLHRYSAFFDKFAERKNKVVGRSEICLHVQSGFD